MVEHKKGDDWFNRHLTPEMKRFEKETNKSAIYRDKVTGQFEAWLWKQQKIKKQAPKKPSMEKILSEAKKGPDEFLKWKRQQDKITEIEKDYQNLKKKSKEELWKIYSRSHRVVSEDKQVSKSSIISFILNDRYRRKDLDAWDIASFKPKPKSPQHIGAWERKSIIKPKTKPKKQVINKKQKRIDEIQREIDWITTGIKNRESNIEEKVKRDKEYWKNLIEKEDNPTVRRRYQKQIYKIRNKYQNEIYKLQTKREKEQAKIIAINLNFNKINKLVKETLKIKSKWHASHQVRGYGESSTGYKITKPTLHDPYITISWTIYWSVSTENRKESIKKFKEKMRPILRENNIKFTEDNDNIFIGKGK